MSLSSQCPQTPHFPHAEVTPRIPRPGILSPCPCAKQHWAQAAGFRKYLLCEVGQTASPHVIALTLTLMTSSGVPRTIFSFDNAQEKLTELTVSYYAHGYGFVCLFFSEKGYHLEPIKGRDTQGKVAELLGILSHGVTVPALMCDSAYGGAYLSLGVHSFYWGSLFTV